MPYSRKKLGLAASSNDAKPPGKPETLSAIWYALTREAAIASGSLCEGATALRKATASAHGTCSYAFFSLSTGIERLAKLIFMCWISAPRHRTIIRELNI